jgi:hypothetical protein
LLYFYKHLFGGSIRYKSPLQRVADVVVRSTDALLSYNLTTCMFTSLACLGLSLTYPRSPQISAGASWD